MTESSSMSCATCSEQFQDLNTLLRHMSCHTAGSDSSTQSRQIVLSQSAFLRLQPFLHQKNSPSVQVVVSHPGRTPAKPAAATTRRQQPPQVAKEQHLEETDDVVAEERREEDYDEDDDDDETPSCRICHRTFKHKYSLVAHCRQHVMSRTCGVCLWRLPSGQELIGHLETHMSRNSTFKCNQCEKSFVHAKSLYVHKRNHTGVKPYVCQYCNKAFRHWHKHRVHVRIHTGERPYVCDVCGWGFPRNDEKKRHMRTHQGQKTFHCVDCGVGCATQMSLIFHMDIHHQKRLDGTTIVGKEGASNERAEGIQGDDESSENADDYIPVNEENEYEIVGTPDENDPLMENDVDGNSAQVKLEGIESNSLSMIRVKLETKQDETLSANQHHTSNQRIKIKEETPDPVHNEIPGVVEIKTEPRDEENMPDELPQHPPTMEDDEQWGSEDDVDFDAVQTHLLEPKIDLTEIVLDIQRMRRVIRDKMAANAGRFEGPLRKQAKSFVTNPDPDIQKMRSILTEKRDEGKRIAQLIESADCDNPCEDSPAETLQKKRLKPEDDEYVHGDDPRNHAFPTSSGTRKKIRLRVKRLPMSKDMGGNTMSG